MEPSSLLVDESIICNDSQASSIGLTAQPLQASQATNNGQAPILNNVFPMNENPSISLYPSTADPKQQFETSSVSMTLSSIIINKQLETNNADIKSDSHETNAMLASANSLREPQSMDVPEEAQLMMDENQQKSTMDSTSQKNTSNFSSQLIDEVSKSSKKRSKAVKRNAKLDAKSKLEKSRQSARECRARKKLRYQYLEDLVCNREKAVVKLREELSMFCEISKRIDLGSISEKEKNSLMDPIKENSNS